MSNQFARLRDKITIDRFENAPMIASPINLLDASPIGDGAAAAVLVPAERVTPAPGRTVVVVAASSSVTDTMAVHSRTEPLFLAAAARSARQCYEMAGVRKQDIDVFEVHDAFSIMAVLSLEACGYAERGQGVRLGLDGEIGIGGSLPICTRGGLKARGHPVGATGMYQIVEIVQQLRGECNGTQVDGASIGMAQNIGGSGATVLTHILSTESRTSGPLS
jgi:acetyl-CoA C-acetyltransferase